MYVYAHLKQETTKSGMLPLVFLLILYDKWRIAETGMTPSAPFLFLHNARWRMKSTSGCFRLFNSITIDACIKECSARRQRCKSVNYKRLYNVCELCTDINEAALITDVGTATVLLDDDSLELASDEKCRNTTCSRLQKCVTNDETGVAICDITECEITDFLAERFGGETVSASVNSAISFQSETCQQKSSTSCDIIECRLDGTWSLTFQNKALGRPTWQISTAYDGHPDRAVDGMKNSVYLDGFCSHTGASLQPWWLVDLGSSQCVNEIRIFNRADCCSERLRNLYVYVSENSNSYTHSDLCARYPGQASPGEVIKLECCPSQRGRFVRLQTDYRAWDLGGEENVLTLCEVEVY